MSKKVLVISASPRKGGNSVMVQAYEVGRNV